MLRTLTRVALSAPTRVSCSSQYLRCVSTLKSNPHLYVFDHPSQPSSYLITFLSSSSPSQELAVGSSPHNPPTPASFRENPKFLPILQSVIAEHGHSDPQIRAQAAAMASSSGASFFQVNRRTTTGSAGGSDQGGAGSGGVGGYIHVSDNRHPPDFGRIAEPEDIFGSLEVDGDGSFTDGHGKYQQSGTYRVCTNDGILGLPDLLRKKLVERLQVEEAALRNR